MNIYWIYLKEEKKLKRQQANVWINNLMDKLIVDLFAGQLVDKVAQNAKLIETIPNSFSA